MKIITNLNHLDDFALSPVITKQLKSHLLAPFNNIEEANECWSNTNTQLIFIENIGSLYDKTLLTLTATLAENAEFVDVLTPNGSNDSAVISALKHTTTTETNTYLLSLTITSQDGMGIYILTPVDHSLECVRRLLPQLNP